MGDVRPNSTSKENPSVFVIRFILDHGYLVQCNPSAKKGSLGLKLGVTGLVVSCLDSEILKNVLNNIAFDNLFTSFNLLNHSPEQGWGYGPFKS